jgi:site-specific DNA recombinase
MLRERMPLLHQRQQTLRAQLQAIADQTNDRAAFLRLAATITAFLARLRSAAETLSVTERQRIVRLLVKDVLGGTIPSPFATAFQSLPARLNGCLAAGSPKLPFVYEA